MTKKYRNNKSSKKRSIKKYRRRSLKRSFFKRILRGGSDFGPATWNDSMKNPYTMYSQNNYANDSSMPPLGAMNSRNIGGGKKRSTRRKIKGGSHDNTSSFGNGPSLTNLVPFSFGSSFGASSANILTGAGLPTTSAINDNSNRVSGVV
jgi:hypothetical protein